MISLSNSNAPSLDINNISSNQRYPVSGNLYQVPWEIQNIKVNITMVAIKSQQISLHTKINTKISFRAMQLSSNNKRVSCWTQKGSTQRGQISLWPMQPSSNIKRKSCWTQKGSTQRSEISLRAMQLSSNNKRRSCWTQKGSTQRSKISFRAMPSSSNIKKRSC